MAGCGTPDIERVRGRHRRPLLTWGWRREAAVSVEGLANRAAVQAGAGLVSCAKGGAGAWRSCCNRAIDRKEGLRSAQGVPGATERRATNRELWLAPRHGAVLMRRDMAGVSQTGSGRISPEPFTMGGIGWAAWSMPGRAVRPRVALCYCLGRGSRRDQGARGVRGFDEAPRRPNR